MKSKIKVRKGKRMRVSPVGFDRRVVGGWERLRKRKRFATKEERSYLLPAPALRWMLARQVEAKLPCPCDISRSPANGPLPRLPPLSIFA